MKYSSTFMLGLLMAIPAMAAENIAGVYKTIDDETGEAKSLVQIYAHQGKMYGRVVKLFQEPDKTAVGIKGDPKIVGLDVVWDMQDAGLATAQTPGRTLYKVQGGGNELVASRASAVARCGSPLRQGAL